MISLLVAIATGSTYPPPRAQLVLGGPAETALDLYRSGPGSDKVYVVATLPDNSPALFLVDTGASISVIHREVIDRLGLPVEAVDGTVGGLSGQVAWRRAVLPNLRLGEMRLNAVDVATDVPGVPEYTGALPVAGILGNNVWTNFAMEIDYPADTLVLHAPGSWGLRKREGAPLVLDGMHAMTTVDLRTPDGHKGSVVLQLDTGAQDVLFIGDAAETFRPASTRGVEPVLGIGADLDELPIQNFLQITRRVPMDRIGIGGRTFRHETRASWYGADDQPPRSDFPGLLGYAPMSQWLAVLDFPNQRFALKKSKRAPRNFDANAAWLELERSYWGEVSDRAVIRGRLQYVSGDAKGARETVLAGLAARPKDAELTTLLSWIQRNDQEWDASLDTLAAASPQELAEEREWIAYVASLILTGQRDRALKEASDAVANGPKTGDTVDDLLVALSDALVAAGKANQARAAIDEATSSTAGGSAHLMRKARTAAADDDRLGALAALRELWTVYPLNGMPFWMYASIAKPEELDALRVGIDESLARLHPGDEPWDFVGAAWLAMGEEKRGREALAKGYQRDCAPMSEGPDRANCDAWYWALGKERLDEAKARIDSAIAERTWASAYHDTAATVAWAAGRTEDARREALLAARLSPGDPYLLWQLDRVGATIPSR